MGKIFQHAEAQDREFDYACDRYKKSKEDRYIYGLLIAEESNTEDYEMPQQDDVAFSVAVRSRTVCRCSFYLSCCKHITSHLTKFRRPIAIFN